MASTSKLTNLSLHGKGLKLDTRADIEPYLKDVDPSIIEEIHLGGNTIGVDASLALAEFLQKTQVLKVADFADIFTGRLISEIPQALGALCDALKDKPSLVEINLSDNAFGGRSVDPMVPLLTYNHSIEILRLNNNGLGPAGGEVIANALRASAELSKAAGLRSNLKTVICGRNRLENGSAGAWADAFAAHGTLVEVRMFQNGIRMEGITRLGEGLSKCPDIQHIDLQDNTFTVDGELDGVELWANVVSGWPHLHTLNLSDCVLSTEGEVPALLTTLTAGSNPKLHTLQLQNNNLEEESFALIAGAIGTGLKTLQRLELQWNEVDEDNEHIQNIGLSLKARGGKLIATEDDEAEDEEEEEEVDESEVKPAPSGKDETDELADLFGKVTVQ